MDSKNQLEIFVKNLINYDSNKVKMDVIKILDGQSFSLKKADEAIFWAATQTTVSGISFGLIPVPIVGAIPDTYITLQRIVHYAAVLVELYGYDCNTEEGRVLAMSALADQAEIKTAIQFVTTARVFGKQTLNYFVANLIKKILIKLGANVTRGTFFKMLPVVGAVVSGEVNNAMTNICLHNLNNQLKAKVL